MLKRTILMTLLLIPLSLFAGGSKEEANSDGSQKEETLHEEAFSLEVTDSAGELITLNKPVSRLVSLGPVVTETVYALGREELLVGRTDWCDYPPECMDLPSVGDIQSPSTETILSLDPDLVLSSGHAPMEEIALLSNAGISTGVFYGPQEFAGVYEVITGIASLLDASDEGDRIMADMKKRAEVVVENVFEMEDRPRVYYVVGFGEGGDWTAGGDTFMHEMITMAGGNNIAGDIQGWSFSLETLIEEDPEIIIISSGLKDIFCSSEFYSELSAVKNDMVFGINENVVVRMGPRLIEGLELLHDIFSSITE